MHLRSLRLDGERPAGRMDRDAMRQVSGGGQVNRRGFFGLLSWLASGSAAVPAAAKPEPCVTPAYAGFDGSFLLYNHASRHAVRLARARATSPSRWSLANGRLGYWYNDDGSVSKLVYRNADGKLFDLQFVPMEEP